MIILFMLRVKLILLLETLKVNANPMLTQESCYVHHHSSFMSAPVEARTGHRIRDEINGDT